MVTTVHLRTRIMRSTAGDRWCWAWEPGVVACSHDSVIHHATPAPLNGQLVRCTHARHAREDVRRLDEARMCNNIDERTSHACTFVRVRVILDAWRAVYVVLYVFSDLSSSYTLAFYSSRFCWFFGKFLSELYFLLHGCFVAISSKAFCFKEEIEGEGVKMVRKEINRRKKWTSGALTHRPKHDEFKGND